MTLAPPTPRQDWMSTLARAPAARLAGLMPDLPPHDILRRPEVGTVMVRGRTGATGAPFNLGEMTVTRCSVRLACGTAGHAWVQGRDRGQALRAAILDAQMQRGEAAAAAIVATLAAEAQAARADRAARAAATRVEFFTLVRGEDT